MHHPNHPDGDYQTANKVHVLDPPRAIGWLTGYDPKGDGHLEFGGWFWRYDLAPLGPSETEVTLTYDWSAVPQSIREYLHFRSVCITPTIQTVTIRRPTRSTCSTRRAPLAG